MKKLLLAAVLGCAAMSADAATIDFEGLSTGLIPHGYSGFNWGNFTRINTDAASGSGYVNSATSGNEVAVNGFGVDAYLYNAAGFDLKSAYFTAAFRDGLQLTVEGFRYSDLLFSQTVTLNPYAPQLFTFDFAGLTSARFSTTGGTFVYGTGFHFAMDDLTVTASSVEIPVPTGVPEGGPGLLGLAVLGGMILSHRPRYN